MRGVHVLAVLALGCAGKTAMLLEVTAEDEGLRVDRLAFVVSPEVTVSGHDPRFVRDDGSSVAVDVSGRDLVADPYRLMLSDGREGAGDTPVLAAVLGYRAGEDDPVAFGALPPRRFIDGEVVRHVIVLEERSDVAPTSTGCLRWSDGVSVDPGDRDCDGARPPADCDDLDPAVSPRRGEVCDNDKDDDCDGAVDEVQDADGDGVDSCRDCDDRDAFTFPGAPERCDGRDNDCGGLCDEGLDGDGDGLTTCGTVPGEGEECGPTGPGDCRDADPGVGPGEVDRCDGRDEDCDGRCDSRGADDNDDDGYTRCGTLAMLPAVPGETCGATSPLQLDCDDEDGDVHPFAHELCNGDDDNCDGRGLGETSCVAADGQGCALGRAACDDDSRDGPSGLGPCVLDGPRVPVDAALCAAWSNCADADRFRCAVLAAATWRVDCELWVRRLPADPQLPERLEVCPGASTELPPVPEVAGCVWQVVGELAQEQLRVGLQATRLAPVVSRLASCAGRFAVTALASPLGVEPDTVTVLYGDLARPQARAARFRLRPRFVGAVGTCPPSPLVCNIVGP
jgi:hypothetical protein